MFRIEHTEWLLMPLNLIPLRILFTLLTTVQQEKTTIASTIAGRINPFFVPLLSVRINYLAFIWYKLYHNKYLRSKSGKNNEIIAEEDLIRFPFASKQYTVLVSLKY